MKKLIFGYGATGKSVETYFQKNNIGYFIHDDDELIEISTKKIFSDEKFEDIDEVIISPGIKPNHPLLKEVNIRGLNVVTDIDIFNNIYKGKIIGVTGTNGKTTFVNLLTDFLNSQGKKAVAVGNVGNPPLEAIKHNYEYIVIELSSFQLFYLNNINLYIGIILNIYEDHLDWHKSFEEYTNSKKRIKSFVKSENKFFGTLNPGSTTSDLYSEIKNSSQFYSNTIDLFMEVTEELKLDYKSAKEFLINSSNKEHRFELCFVHNGVTYINDSKSTNFNSLSMATKKVKNAILIMHGLTKNITSKDLDISKDIKKIIIPKDMEVNLENIKAEIIEIESIFDLEATLKKHLGSVDTVLFSCGGASFNDFNNYEERGIYFKSVITNIKEKDA